MKIGTQHKRESCPKCGSTKILTLGWDQMCCDCNWDNTMLLVNLGQLDNLGLAAKQQFESEDEFENSDELKTPQSENGKRSA